MAMFYYRILVLDSISVWWRTMKLLNDKSDLVTSPSQYSCLFLLYLHLIKRRVSVTCKVSHSTLMLVHFLPLPLRPLVLSLSFVSLTSPCGSSLSAYKGGHDSTSKRLPFLPIDTSLPFFVLSHKLIERVVCTLCFCNSPLIPSSDYSGLSPILVHSTKTSH